MNSKKVVIKALLMSLAIAMSAGACAAPQAQQTDSMKLSADGKQATFSGTGLQSLINEMGNIGLDPNKLRTLDADGSVVTPFTPGVSVQWQRITSVSPTGTGLHANDVANGKGSPGDIEIDTVKTGTTITVFTWQYQKLSNGTYGWMAIGVVTYTIQAGTQQK